MTQPAFFKQPPSITLAEIAALTKAELADSSRGGFAIRGLASLERAGPFHLTFFDNLKYARQLETTQAGACLVSPRFAPRVPSHVTVLESRNPFAAFVTLARALHEDALKPQSTFGSDSISPAAIVHETARLEDGVVVDPLAVIGPSAEIGAGTLIGSGAVIGPDVKIGRDCTIGAGTSIRCSLIGNNVIIHSGCHIGQDGYGYIPGPAGHIKIPQTGRVIIQNNVEIGAGSTVDRGSLRDTVIGEGTKIDNQVQIGHNVAIGRNCLIVAQVGMGGSSTLEDNVVLGAKVGLNNHVVLGEGAQVAALSGVNDDVPAGERWGGIFARPARQWMRQFLALERLAKEAGPGGRDARGEGRD